MNILLLGSGGREHAFARALTMSPLCDELFIAPGNPGTAMCGTNVDVSPNDFESIKNIVLSKDISLVLVGPEDPLVNGIADFFEADASLKAIPVIGPSRSGARLEGSKTYSKDFMKRYAIPTAAYRSFTEAELTGAIQFIEGMQPPYVLKADGLAAGKGVLIPGNKADAIKELTAMLSENKFGAAGNKVVIEEFMHGIEVSVFVLCDGEHYVILPEAKDYKRIGEGDTGLNTGGMGAVSPVNFVNETFMKKVEERIIKPTINGLRSEGIMYRGFIFIGLMNVAGEPFVVEYNCRMGDPETEAVMPRIKNDFVELLMAVANGTLDKQVLDIDERIAATVVMTSGGYPLDYVKGKIVSGLDDDLTAMVFHAGTKSLNGNVHTNGGRVFAVTTLASTLEEALEAGYSTVSRIRYEDAYYRRDIGRDLLKLQ